MNNKSKQSPNVEVSITPELEKLMDRCQQGGEVDYVFPTFGLSSRWKQLFRFNYSGMNDPDFISLRKRLNPSKFTPFRYTRSKQGKLNARRRKKRKNMIARLKWAGQVKNKPKK